MFGEKKLKICVTEVDRYIYHAKLYTPQNMGNWHQINK